MLELVYSLLAEADWLLWLVVAAAAAEPAEYGVNVKISDHSSKSPLKILEATEYTVKRTGEKKSMIYPVISRKKKKNINLT